MKIKGLVLRELYLGRKNYIMILLIWFGISMLGFLIRLSMLYGNLANMPAEDLAENARNMYVVFTYIPIILMMCPIVCNCDTLYSDFTSNWLIFSYTTPISEEKYVGVKYIIKAVFIILSLALNILNSMILSALYGKSIDRDQISIFLVITLLTTIIALIINQLSYKYKNIGKMQNMMLLIVAVIIGGFVVVLFCEYNYLMGTKAGFNEAVYAEMLKNKVMSLPGMFNNLILLWPVLILLFLGAGYYLDVIAMKRREK